MNVGEVVETVGKISLAKKTAIAGGLLAAFGYGVAKGDPVQHAINATQEAVFGTDQVDNMLLGTDLRFRDFFPGPLGFGRTTALGLLYPKENVASMFSKRRLNGVPFNYLRANPDKVERLNRNAADASYDEDGRPVGYSQYPSSNFPQRMTNRTWDSASGDIVLGSYNLRRG